VSGFRDQGSGIRRYQATGREQAAEKLIPSPTSLSNPSVKLKASQEEREIKEKRR
jgi:hypothetical protein